MSQVDDKDVQQRSESSKLNARQLRGEIIADVGIQENGNDISLYLKPPQHSSVGLLISQLLCCALICEFASLILSPLQLSLCSCKYSPDRSS